MCEPLQELLEKNVDVVQMWSEDRHGAAFKAIKRAFCTAPVLQLPDYGKPFRIEVDGSNTSGRGIGAVLLQPAQSLPVTVIIEPIGQGDDGKPHKWKIIAYFSKLLTVKERQRFGATEVEAKALHDSIMHWAPYLQNGQTFDIVVDHRALVYLIVAPTETRVLI